MIVGNESEAGHFEKFRVRYLWVQFIANVVNSDFAHGCNLSVAQASGEQMLFMNPDVIAGCDGLKDKGCYMVEDMHTNYWTSHVNMPQSFMELAKQMVDMLHEPYLGRKEINFRH